MNSKLLLVFPHIHTHTHTLSCLDLKVIVGTWKWQMTEEERVARKREKKSIYLQWNFTQDATPHVPLLSLAAGLCVCWSSGCWPVLWYRSGSGLDLPAVTQRCFLPEQQGRGSQVSAGHRDWEWTGNRAERQVVCGCVWVCGWMYILSPMWKPCCHSTDFKQWFFFFFANASLFIFKSNHGSSAFRVTGFLAHLDCNSLNPEQK